VVLDKLKCHLSATSFAGPLLGSSLGIGGLCALPVKEACHLLLQRPRSRDGMEELAIFLLVCNLFVSMAAVLVSMYSMTLLPIVVAHF
jgi:hypothetical protein